MNGILFWLIAALAGLLCVAVVVAWWEHLGRRPPVLDSGLPPAETTADARMTAVDLDLDRLPELAESDAAQRREALGRALERMTQPGALGASQASAAKRPEVRQVWVDTAPMVGPGAPQPSVGEKAS